MAIGSTSSAEPNLRPAWMRWLVPSVGDLLFVALLGLLACTNLSTRLLGDAGVGWHIRTGQLILTTHSIPHVDPFSSTMSGRPWFAWEWLYDVIVGWLDSAAGLNGVVLFTSLIIATVFAGAFRLLLRGGTDAFLAVILVLLAASASMIHFLARPHVVSWLFTVVWFWILESSERSSCGSDSERPGSLRLWLLPVLMLVWVNLHGGFLVGFALLAIYWVSAAWRWFTLTGDRLEDVLQKIRTGNRSRALVVTAVLSALATLVNPYGWNLHIHIYRYLSNRFLMDHIDEFQSPNFHGVAQKCFAVLLLLALVGLATKNRESGASQTRSSQGLLVLFAVYTGLYASRNIPVSSLLLILVIGPRLSNAMTIVAGRRIGFRLRNFASTHLRQRMQVVESSLHGHIWPVAAIALACWIGAHGGKMGSTLLMDAHFDAKRFPVDGVNYLEKHDVQGPVLSPDSWGGYLIYRLYPQTKVVVDDRHDLYGEAFLQSYLKMVHVEPGWDDFLHLHEAHCLIAPKDSALANILAETAGWKPIYEDKVAAMFVSTPAPPQQKLPQ
jgi:hypothetical protein